MAEETQQQQPVQMGGMQPTGTAQVAGGVPSVNINPVDGGMGVMPMGGGVVAEGTMGQNPTSVVAQVPSPGQVVSTMDGGGMPPMAGEESKKGSRLGLVVLVVLVLLIAVGGGYFLMGFWGKGGVNLEGLGLPGMGKVTPTVPVVVAIYITMLATLTGSPVTTKSNEPSNCPVAPIVILAAGAPVELLSTRKEPEPIVIVAPIKTGLVPVLNG